tara:strand:+ start:2766 stop:3584 length:819 start_codon:yes stop_codon:yes gene_type:complete
MKYTNYFVGEEKEGNTKSNSTLGKTYMGVSKSKTDQIVLHEYPKKLLKMGTQYLQHKDYDAADNNLVNADITDSSSEQCKQYCINRGQECKGFVYDKANNSCKLKGDIYPNTKREENKSKDIYTRMPEIMDNDSSCPKSIKAVSADFLAKDSLLSNDPMSMDFQCETEGSVTKAEEGLESAYKTLTDQVSSLKGENTNIIKGFEKVRQQVKSNIKGYNNTDEEIKKHIKETPSLNQLLMDSEKLETLFSMRNTGYVLLLILLSILLVRVLRK